jgi:uncharacterized DUF497 family protein
VIEEFDWTDHARQRISEREFARVEVESTIHLGHDRRRVNDGRAEWQVMGEDGAGRPFVVIYDHPAEGNVAKVRIVSVWELTERELC